LRITHPISLVSVILTQTTIICGLRVIISSSSWFALIIFLIFVGGVIVLFIYIASLASNENFILNSKSFILTFLLSLVILFAYRMFNNPTPLFYLDLNFSTFIMKIYNPVTYPLVIITIAYLLLTLIITVEIIKHYQAPLRSEH